MAESPISKLSNQYHEWVRVHPRAARDFRDAIEDLLNDAGVISTVSPRGLRLGPR